MDNFDTYLWAVYGALIALIGFIMGVVITIDFIRKIKIIIKHNRRIKNRKKMDINFKQVLENTIIPTIKNMIDKEEKHLKMLKNHDQTNEEVKSFILYSEENLNYLNDKLEEYTKYLKNEH